MALTTLLSTLLPSALPPRPLTGVQTLAGWATQAIASPGGAPDMRASMAGLIQQAMAAAGGCGRQWFSGHVGG